ncbi:uncharacterized protein LOC128267966 [Anopheles cruzii]|uniref:uncharacterized protein LOC128267966 n=1 Tax=Anopheles cruzii TaxID=68878 RepID=UPI0022EC6DB4|nr:uncharacterized protein LOC128267966 [Anopheles cruzii]
MNLLKPFHSVCFLFLALLSVLKCHTLESEDLTHLSDREIVDTLVKQWAPLVWLAPNEKYMPGDVSKFLEHVHAEEAKVVTVYPGSEITELEELSGYDNGLTNELSYYDPMAQERQGRFRNKRNFKDPSTSLDLLFDLPIGNESKSWYLVTNGNVEELIADKESFIHGQNPLKDDVPIYAVISMCKQPLPGPALHMPDSLPFPLPTTTIAYQSTPVFHSINNQENEVTYTAKDRPPFKRNPYAPTPKNIFELQPNLRQGINKVEKSIRLVRKRRELQDESAYEAGQLNDIQVQADPNEADETGRRVVSDSIGAAVDNGLKYAAEESTESAAPSEENEEWETITERRHDQGRYPEDSASEYPHFHVTYWMFYPYSQGKVICTIDLGPFGPWPIPLIFGMCLGTKKEFGSHVGDWEHMSLSFRGRREPDEMYVSAHDAGAFYSYERLTGTFEYHSQETRKGILQQPTFPKTVVTSGNHPVLFAAEGSHGLWTAPGKHKFVRVPRLYDINGFGLPWSTWRNVELIHENDAKGRSSLRPKWMKFNGRWGNPKTKCHPLKRIGLHICELTDGPTGIPRKKHHFKCKAR